jgi:hypothetical protein
MDAQSEILKGDLDLSKLEFGSGDQLGADPSKSDIKTCFSCKELLGKHYF